MDIRSLVPYILKITKLISISMYFNKILHLQIKLVETILPIAWLLVITSWLDQFRTISPCLKAMVIVDTGLLMLWLFSFEDTIA